MKYTEPLYPDSFYHIYSHAVGEENLFRTEENYRYFLKKYSEYIHPVCKTLAYCLMPNHFHFSIKVRDEKGLKKYYDQKRPIRSSRPYRSDGSDWNAQEFVIQQFSNFLNAYAKAFNKKFQRKGALFVDYLRRKSVTNDRYLITLIHYIHYNPLHHGFCKDLKDWTFTSYHALRTKRPTRLEKQEVLSLFGGLNSFDDVHEKIPDGRLEEELEMF